MTKSKNKDLIIYLLKNSQTSNNSPSIQTQKYRDDTNEKIRQLGNKYYIVKNLFERFKLRRDDIFSFGKKLEKEYKNIKKGIILPNRKRRMKDSLYCWYAEHFFDEICSTDGILLKRLIQESQNSPNLPVISKKKPQNNSKKVLYSQKKKNTPKEKSKSNESSISLFNQILINQEVDSFDVSDFSFSNDPSNKLFSDKTNNDYENLLNF